MRLTWDQFLRKMFLINKRLFDILVALFGLIILLPIYLIIKVIYQFGENRGPVFYHQKRIGKNGQPFQIYKIRTMIVNADQILKQNQQFYQNYVAHGYKLSAKQDFRITKVGAFLRRWSLDELPQVWNILKGDMSVIGPRPLIKEELGNYKTKEKINELLSVRPGGFGYWEVMGRSNINYPERCDLELFYVRHLSFKLDLKIFLTGIISIIKHTGAY